MSANNNKECNEFHEFGDCEYCDLSKFDNCIECTGRVWDSDIGRHIEDDDDCDGSVLCKKCVAKEAVKLSKCFYCDDDKICRYRFGLVTICDDCEGNDCICGEEPNKNCDQHCCIQCYEPKASFNNVAWLCAPCQKKIDDETDYTDKEEEDDMCECENCGADFDNEGWSPKMKYCEHCDDELRNNGL